MGQISPEKHAAGCYLAAQAVKQQWSKQEPMQRAELCEDEDVLQGKTRDVGACDLCNSELQVAGHT